MGSLLDALGAVVIGGLFLVAMFNALSNVQAVGYNTNIQTTLNEISERVISGTIDDDTGETIPGISNGYLSKVGAGIDSLAVLLATDSTFQFRIKDSVSASIDTILIYKENDSLKLMRNGSMEFGPFELSQNSDNLKFTYYDVNENEITSTQDSLSYIRSVRIDIEFFANTYRGDSDKRVINNKIVLWQYFKNLYL